MTIGTRLFVLSMLLLLTPAANAAKAYAPTSVNMDIKKVSKHVYYVMGAAVNEFTPFDEAYAEADWSRFQNLPAFAEGNRINAFQVYLSMEAELLEQ